MCKLRFVNKSKKTWTAYRTKKGKPILFWHLVSRELVDICNDGPRAMENDTALLCEFCMLITSERLYRYINVIWFCMHWLAMSNSCYNPFIYAIYSEKFSAEFKARMSCCLKRKFEDSAFMASSIISQVSFRIKY
ncbi:hypothetical protein HPB51_020121 [Rhipicephalus microplus]|uniref:Uncharacterized protein n=1 Tax=Rhipicephalus microplus TaxID=6941 RepID=A0A9J6EJA0_RHIMP|nr:hypothetical protein HPB51_020121 [Rhipicephalus microplus]